MLARNRRDEDMRRVSVGVVAVVIVNAVCKNRTVHDILYANNGHGIRTVAPTARMPLTYLYWHSVSVGTVCKSLTL